MTLSSRESWQKGYGVIRHSEETIARAENLVTRHWQSGALRNSEEAYALLAAADRLASAAMWVVAHMTYASRVGMDGAELPAAAFKKQPEGHTGGSLNMAIAYVGYLTANALSGHTRAWTLGQGHCVAAIEAVKQDTVAAINVESFAGAMRALAELRVPVDAFFEKVTVNVDDPKIRENRLRMLSEIRAATLNVADFSKIAG